MAVKVLNGIDKIRSQAGTDLTIDDSVAEQARLETDKLDKAGGTITGNLSISGTLTNTALTASIASKLDSSTTPTPTGTNDVLKWDGSNFINVTLSSTGMTTTGFVNPATTSGPSDVLQWDGSNLVNVSGFATETSVIGKMPSNVSQSAEVVQWDGSNLVNVSGFVQDSDILNKMPSASTPLGSVVTWDGSRLQNTTGMATLTYVQSLRPAAASTSNEVVKWNGNSFENTALSTVGFTTTGFVTPATTSGSTDVLHWDGSNFINVSGFAQIGTASTLTDLGLMETAVNAKAEAPPTQSTTGTYLYHDGSSWQYGTPVSGGASFGTPSADTASGEMLGWTNAGGVQNVTATSLGLATETYVDTAISNLLGGASSAYDTLKEIENYITNSSDTNMTNLLNDLSLKVAKPTASTPADEVLIWNNTSSALETKSWDAAGVFEIVNNGTDYTIRVKSALVP